jgi:hypothetical protein
MSKKYVLTNRGILGVVQSGASTKLEGINSKGEYNGRFVYFKDDDILTSSPELETVIEVATKITSLNMNMFCNVAMGLNFLCYDQINMLKTELEKIKLKLIHLIELDMYAIVNNDTVIELHCPVFRVGVLIGMLGNNINNIKTKYGINVVKIKEIRDDEEYENFKILSQRKLLFMLNYKE